MKSTSGWGKIVLFSTLCLLPIIALLYYGYLWQIKSDEYQKQIRFNGMAIINESTTKIYASVVLGKWEDDFGVITPKAAKHMGFGGWVAGDSLAVVWSYEFPPKQKITKTFDPSVLLTAKKETEVQFVYLGGDKWEIRFRDLKY